MTIFAIAVFGILAICIFFIIDEDMERYANKQARRRQAGLSYVNVPGAEKDQN